MGIESEGDRRKGRNHTNEHVKGGNEEKGATFMISFAC